MVSLANVSLRKALQPMIDGIRSFANVTSVMGAWSNLS